MKQTINQRASRISFFENPKFVGSLGSVLIWVGVLSWVPFLLLRSIGYTPSLFYFLPFHLFGVIGGSRLRKKAREMLGDVSKKPAYKKMGHALVILGVLMWGPYFILKATAPPPIEIQPWLTLHLSGVLSGIAVLFFGKVFIKRKIDIRN